MEIKYLKYNKNLEVPPCYDLEFIAHLLKTIKNTALMNSHCAQYKKKN